MERAKLAAARYSKGWSQEAAAQQIGVTRNTLSQWERGISDPYPLHVHRLCEVYEKTAVELGLVLDVDISPVAAIASMFPHSQEIENTSLRRAGHLQAWLIDSLEDGTRLRWQLYYTSSNTLTSDGLLNQIMKLEFLALESAQDHARVRRVLAQNYQLAGSLARDRFQHRTAREYFRKAQQVIDVGEFPDMTATAIARHALVYLRQDRVDKALTLYESAVTIAEHAEPFVRAYVLSGLAEVYARNKEKDNCYRMLDQAEEYLYRVQQVPIEEDFAYVCPTLQSLEDARGECYVLLGEAEKGLHYLQTAQQQLDQKISRNHCRLLMQHAEAFFVADQPDQCVAYTLEGLQLARTMESVSNINWAREIYTKLQSSDRKKEHAVKSLREALHE